MRAEDESSRQNYDSPYWQFVRETAERADRLPDWKKGETGAVAGESAHENRDTDRRWTPVQHD